MSRQSHSLRLAGPSLRQSPAGARFRQYRCLPRSLGAARGPVDEPRRSRQVAALRRNRAGSAARIIPASFAGARNHRPVFPPHRRRFSRCCGFPPPDPSLCPAWPDVRTCENRARTEAPAHRAPGKTALIPCGHTAVGRRIGLLAEPRARENLPGLRLAFYRPHPQPLETLVHHGLVRQPQQDAPSLSPAAI